MSALRPYLALLRRDFRLALRRQAEVLLPLAFAVLVVLLFSIALGGAPSKLAPVAAPVIWVTVLLAGFLSLEGLFRPDVDDGTLDQWLAGPTSMVGLMYSKAIAHWLLFGVGLTAATPVLAMLLKLPVALLPVLLVALAIGTFGATQIGLIAAALTARLRRSGILLAIIVLPLYLPLLIFGSGAVEAVRLGDSPRGALLLLAAQTLLLTTLAAPAAAAGLRIGSDNPP
jgi:heme exporter protein B